MFDQPIIFKEHPIEKINKKHYKKIGNGFQPKPSFKKK